MEVLKIDKTIWEEKINSAITTFSFIQDEIHNSIICLNDKLNKMDLKTKELSKTLESLNLMNDINVSLFSPYENKQKNNEKANLKIELNDINNDLPKIQNQLSELNHKQTEYQVVRECLDYLAQLIKNPNQEEDNDDHLNNMEINVNTKNDGLKILETQELERQRIARDLHDSAVQNLTSLMHKTELCIKLIDIDEIRARLELATLITCTKNIINDMRETIFNLRPMTIQDLGLVPTIERFSKKYMEQYKIQIVFNHNEEKTDILPVISLTLYRILQEACNNIAKYASASICTINLTYEENQISLVIEDNGIGMQKEDIKFDLERNDGFGLSIMRERALLLSGTFEIESTKGNGTKIEVNIPYRKQKEE